MRQDMTNLPHNLTIPAEIPLYKGTSVSEVMLFNLTLTSLYPHSIGSVSMWGSMSFVEVIVRLIVRLKVRFAVRLGNIGNSLCKVLLRDFSEVKTRLRLTLDEITARCPRDYGSLYLH